MTYMNVRQNRVRRIPQYLRFVHHLHSKRFGNLLTSLAFNATVTYTRKKRRKKRTMISLRQRLANVQE